MNSRAVVLSSVVVLAFLANCSGGTTSDDDDDGSGGSKASGGFTTSGGTVDDDGGSSTMTSGGGCDTAPYEGQAVAICDGQFPPPPAPGTLGADCSTNGQCNSNYCLQPGGQQGYCSVPCPNGNECALGYACQDTGNGTACYKQVCIYGGSDKGSCVVNVLAEAQAACQSSCLPQLEAWLGCLQGAGLICNNSQADDVCGSQRGLLENCCPTCSSSSW